MGNSTGSMFYMFLLVIIIYIVGMSIYQLVQWIKKKRRNQQEKDADFKEEKKPEDHS